MNKIKFTNDRPQIKRYVQHLAIDILLPRTDLQYSLELSGIYGFLHIYVKSYHYQNDETSLYYN